MSASASNIIYYWHTILNSRFQKLLQQHLSPLLEVQEVVLVCKSSGVNMLTQWLRNVGKEVSLPRLRVIALGPVSQLLLRQKEVEVLVIKGKKILIHEFWTAIQRISKWIRIIIAMNTEKM